MEEDGVKMQRSRFEFSTGENIKITAVWEVIPSILMGIYRLLVGPPAYFFWTRISVGFLLYHEDGESVFLRNVDKLQVYTASHPRKLSVCDMS